MVYKQQCGVSDRSGEHSENTLPPPLDISALVADRKAYLLDSAIRLPPRTRDLEIDYTALSFVAPQKVRFRYMLGVAMLAGRSREYDGRPFITTSVQALTAFT